MSQHSHRRQSGPLRKLTALQVALDRLDNAAKGSFAPDGLEFSSKVLSP